MKELQTKDAYCRCIKEYLHIPSVQKIFKLDNNTLYRQTQASDKNFEALIVPKSLIPIILINSHHLKGHAGKTKSCSLIKREFFWKGMHEDIRQIHTKLHNM